MARSARQRASWGSNEDAGQGRRRLRYWADLHDGRGYRRVSETIRGSRREGDLVLAQRRVEHDSDAPVPTLAQAYEAWWLPDARDRVEKGELAPRTLTQYESYWGTHVAPAFGRAQVTGIRPLAIQDWLLALPKTSAPKSLGILAQVLDLCVRYEVMGANPARMRYRMPQRVERAHDKAVWTYRDAVAAADALRGGPAYLPTVLSLFGSCRVGEALGPRVDMGEVRPWESHGMTLAVVDIRRQVDRRGVVEDALKTAQSARSVIIPEPWSLDVLAVTTPWLCDRGDGMVPSQRQWHRAFGNALWDAGIDPIPLRNLRNSWRTFMRWELGVPEDMCEKMMGHAGRGVGETHYDRPEWDVFADVVAEAYVRYRNGKNV